VQSMHCHDVPSASSSESSCGQSCRARSSPMCTKRLCFHVQHHSWRFFVQNSFRSCCVGQKMGNACSQGDKLANHMRT
jgi:hypothetical protein